MADGNPVGKLFVSLDMDASAYKKAQAEIKKSEATTL